MATRIDAPWFRYGTAAAVFLLILVLEAAAQQFVEPQVQSYPLQHVPAARVEQMLRQFLTQQVGADEPVDIVSDPQGDRILVRGSREVQQAVAQFIPVVDRAVAPAPSHYAQATRELKPYQVGDVDELRQRTAALRKQFSGRADVRIAADERTGQIIVHAPSEVHDQIANWIQQTSNAGAPNPPRVQQNPLPPAIQSPINRQDNVGQAPAIVNSNQMQLQHIDWRKLLQGMRGIHGVNAAITSPRDGELQMSLPSETGIPVNLQIDQQNQVVQIKGDQESTQRWTRVIQALDQRPLQANEWQATGRLGDANPDTITQTIAMLGGAGAGPGTLRTIGQDRANWGGDVVNQLFRPQQPLQMAQAGDIGPGNAVPANGDPAAMLDGDEGGNFLGPVRIEFLEGTDIFIIRGAQRDVDRVMKIIEEIEQRTEETEPSIEVYPLSHANSEAVAALINELNSGVLEARLGDVSVTALVKPNALLMIGRPAGVAAVKALIEKLDVPAEASARFRVFTLKHLPAVDAERTITFLYQQVQQTGTTNTGATLTPRVRVVADYRSNSIVVQGSPRDIEEIGNLLEQIDKEDGNSVSEVRVFPLKNAYADEVADVLNEALGTDLSQTAQQGRNTGQQAQQNQQTANTQAFSSRRGMSLTMKRLDEKTNQLIDGKVLESGILSNVVVTSNERTNTVVVTAPASAMELIAEIVRQLDERQAKKPRFGSSRSSMVMPKRWSICWTDCFLRTIKPDHLCSQQREPAKAPWYHSALP